MNPDTKLFFPYHGELVEPSFDGLRMICSTFLLALLLAAGLQASEAGDSKRNAADAENAKWVAKEIWWWQPDMTVIPVYDHLVLSDSIAASKTFIETIPVNGKPFTGILVQPFHLERPSGRALPRSNEWIYIDLTPFKNANEISVSVKPNRLPNDLYDVRVYSSRQHWWGSDENLIQKLEIPSSPVKIGALQISGPQAAPPAPPTPSHSVEVLAAASTAAPERERIALIQAERVVLVEELREQQKINERLQAEIAKLKGSLPKPAKKPVKAGETPQKPVKKTAPKKPQASQADTKYIFAIEPIATSATAQQVREALGHEQKVLDATKRTLAAEKKRYQELFKQRKALQAKKK